MTDNIKAIADIIRHNYDVNSRMDINDIILVTAVALDRAGYRKQSDTVKEFAKKLNALLDVLFDGKPAQKQVRKGMEEGLKMAIEIAAEFGGEGQH